MIPKWWSPTVRAFQMKFEVGGEYRVIWSNSEDPKQQPYGTFTKIVAYEEIEMTWRWESISPDFNSRIRILFREVNGQTEFEFIHENFTLRAEIEPHHEAWEEIMDMLNKYANKIHKDT